MNTVSCMTSAIRNAHSQHLLLAMQHSQTDATHTWPARTTHTAHTIVVIAMDKQIYAPKNQWWWPQDEAIHLYYQPTVRM